MSKKQKEQKNVKSEETECDCGKCDCDKCDCDCCCGVCGDKLPCACEAEGFVEVVEVAVEEPEVIERGGQLFKVVNGKHIPL